MSARPQRLWRLAVALILGLLDLPTACSGPAHARSQPAAPPPPPQPPHQVDVCLSFPASLLGGRDSPWTALPSFHHGSWAAGLLSPGDRERLSALLAVQLRYAPPNATRAYDAAMADLAAATANNLRADLAPRERSRRQQTAFRAAVQRLRTPLAAPRDAQFPEYRLPLEKIATVTWLLAYSDARTQPRPGEEHLLAMIEPLAWITGMSLAHAVDRFTDPSPIAGPWNPDLRFATEVLHHPDGPGTELLSTRALAYTLDAMHGSPAAATPLFRELETALASYFRRVEHPAAASGTFVSPRPAGEVARLLSNRLFLDLRSGVSRPPPNLPDC